MANDDILWKKVEALRQEASPFPKPPVRDRRVPPKTAVSRKPKGKYVAGQKASETEANDGAAHPLPDQVSDITTDQPSKKEGSQASKQASYHASNQASMIEEIRRVVKDTGAKTTFVRLTPEEKNRLLDLVYTYRRQGMKTSENELVRIAIGYLLGDYNERGKESMLARVLAALNA